jgi:hypothetical protein
MKKVNLLFILLTTISALAQGEIIFANRNIPTASGTGGGNGNGTYNMPIWEFNPLPGAQTGNGAGDLPGGVTVGLFTTGGSMIGSSLLRTDANSQFFATSAQKVTVPNAEPGTTPTLLVRFWQGTGFETAKYSGLQWGEMSFTTKPLGGTNTSGVVFPTPGMTGWGPEDGTGWEPCALCVTPPVVEVAVTVKPGFNLVANPLNASDSTIGSLFKKMDGGVPGGTTIYRFVNGSFVPVIWDDLDNKFVPESLAVEPTFPGGGVFLWLPGSDEKVLRFSGTRPRGLCISIPRGFSLLSNGAPQPAPPEIAPAVIGNNPGGDVLFRYNPVTKAYTPHIYDDLDNTWIPPLPTIPPGEAYLYYRAGPGMQACSTLPYP